MANVGLEREGPRVTGMGGEMRRVHTFMMSALAWTLPGCGLDTLGIGAEATTSTESSGSGEMPTTSGSSGAPDAPSLRVGFSAIKQFDFSWSAAAGAEDYQLLEKAGPAAEYVVLAEGIVGEAIPQTVPLHLRSRASYLLRACNVIGCTDSEPVDIDDPLIGAIGYVKASNTQTNDVFGTQIALSADGRTLAVAAYEDSGAKGVNGDQDDNSVPDAGAIYIFVHAGSTWAQEAYIKASNPDENDQFGSHVALSEDGNRLAVGADRESSSGSDPNDNTADSAGAVYVFTRSGQDWAEEGYLKAETAVADGRFGGVLGLSGKGDTLAVGARGVNSGTGAAYVFARSGDGAWTLKQTLAASNPDIEDNFGARLALSADGGTLAIGAYDEASASTTIDQGMLDDTAGEAGAVYVFTRSGDTWTQEAYIKASNTDAGDKFGGAVALSTDGNTLAVGAYAEDSLAPGVNADSFNNDGTAAGAVYVFSRAGKLWMQDAYIKASNPGESDVFGNEVVLSGDGATLVVTASFEASASQGVGGEEADDTAVSAGAAYVFTRGGAEWSQEAYIKAPNTRANSEFGWSVALSADGLTLAVGSDVESSAATGINGDQDDVSAMGAGAVYLY